MIKAFLTKKGYCFDDIVVWNGVIAKLEVINELIKEPEDVRFANKKEIEQYEKHQ